MLAMVHFSLLVIAIRISDIIRQEIHPYIYHLPDISFFTQKTEMTADKMYFSLHSFMIFHLYDNYMIIKYNFIL